MLVLLCLFLVFVIASVIAVTQAQRKISIQYAKRCRAEGLGRSDAAYAAENQLRRRHADYFAQAILLFLPRHQRLFRRIGRRGNREPLAVGWLHYVLYGVMIFFSVTSGWRRSSNRQIADDLKNTAVLSRVRPESQPRIFRLARCPGSPAPAPSFSRLSPCCRTLAQAEGAL